VTKTPQNITIPLPQNITSQHEKYFEQCLKWKYNLPRIKTHFFAFVFSKGYSTSFFLQPLKNIAPWPTFYEKFNLFFFLGKILNAIKKRKLRPLISTEYYYCINEFSNNYYHWVTEVLPKMVYVKNHLNGDCKFFIPYSLTGYQLTSLKICKINFYSSKNDVTLFPRLKVVENFTGSTGYHHPDLLNVTSQLIKNSFSSDRNLKRKVYVTRENALRRRILNDENFKRILIKYGFEIFDFDEIKFEQQVEILMTSNILVAQHGAALTNMIFMQTGSAIVELLPKEVFNDKCYFILAGTMKHHYYYSFCDTDGPSHITSNFVVNINEFETVLTKALSSKELMHD
jgi:capsular polysaccharide biosynthesis protein